MRTRQNLSWKVVDQPCQSLVPNSNLPPRLDPPSFTHPWRLWVSQETRSLCKNRPFFEDMPLSAPTMVPPRKASYRGDLFDTSILTSIDAVEAAADEFQVIVNESNVERILDEVIAQEHPAVVRLVLSSLNEDLVMSCFPATPEGFGASVAFKILSQLSVFFLMLGHSVPSLHEQHPALVNEAPGTLATLSAKLFADGAEPDPAAPGAKKGKATSQKKAKNARRVALTKNTLDPTPFEHLDISIPETPDEYLASSSNFLVYVRQAYLESLRIPAVAESVKAALLPAEPNSFPGSEELLDPTEVDVVPMDQANDSLVSYPTSQHLKFSTLYRKRATGFGEWEVNIAQRADRDLREYNKRDRKTCSLIVKKMRELSNGVFSPDNYKQINGDSAEVPIYEAKVTKDLRLVYQIDCGPIYDKKTEQQMLKIFGVYEEVQLTRGTFWDSMSRELGKKGQEYKDRCALRQPSIASDSDGYTFVPVTFPSPEEARFSPGSVPDLPSDDAEQIQSLLLKTVHFSQELLDHILADREMAVVLQISPRELDIIEYPYSCYVLGRSGTGKSTTIIYKMLMVEASSELTPPTERKIRQLFVCRSPILAEKVGEHFTKLIRGYRPAAVPGNLKAAKKADRALVADADNDWRSDLPKKYSELQDTDFPLFVSFEQLCSMIECDMAAGGVVPARKSTVTYDKFRKEYWPHFQQSLRKGFESSMVFSEFMGVIMGSEETLTLESHSLDRNAYLKVSERSQSTFAHQRGQIYDLFEKYLNEKRLRGDTDLADRTHEILKFLHGRGVPGRKIDYLYVDEVQDNLLVDTLLLRSLCQNPNGLFWAGDTAQTISAGSSFRFNELKAFLFRIQAQRQKKHPEYNFHPAIPPRAFQLTVNYRSHTGIINCAHSIIEVITKLWPDAIDMLDPERGTVDGLRPIFFTNWDSESAQSRQFLFGEQQSGGPIELGAQQCILVRNDAARKKLQALVGDIGLIMSLNESKGLEFNDVLLYNFFEDSGATEKQWRVVLNLVANGPPAPALDNMRHATVCTELKFLYVAITRARNNIWIADCSSKGEPMRVLWTSKDQVQNCILGTDTPRFALSSTAEEWKEQGNKFFQNNRFSQARLCYTRAYMPNEAAVAQAYHLHHEASELPCSSRREIARRKAPFLDAAAAFRQCATNSAGITTRQAYLRMAGECFESAEDFDQAISAYTSAQCFGRVAELYQHLGKFDDAVATVQDYRRDIDSHIYERVISAARIFYFNKKQTEKARKLFIKPEEALIYLEERGAAMNGERATILESLGRLSDAAKIHVEDGQTSKAIALFLKDQNTERASDAVLRGLWEQFSFGVLPDTKNAPVSDLLETAAQIDVSAISQSKRDEISMFYAIANGEKSKLRLLGHSFLRIDNQPAALLCFDQYFTELPKIPTLPIAEVAENLEVFFEYVKLLYKVVLGVDPCSSAATRKLFGYRKEGENAYYIPPGTYLYLALSDSSSDNRRLLTGSELRTIFQHSLRARMVEKIREENEMCRITQAFGGSCPTFALFNGHCNRGNCPQEHISLPAFDSRQYNLRVRIHLQQILIYQGLMINGIDTDQRRFWLSRLYAVLNPLSYHLGSAVTLELGLIPEAQPGLQLVKEWIRDCVYTLRFKPELHFVTQLIQLAELGFQFDGRNAMAYLNRGPFMVDSARPEIYQRFPDKQYVVAEFITALEDRYGWSVSYGVSFLRHVILSGLDIQVNVLCDLAEHICTRLVVADRLGPFGSIHNITLPLSWLVKRPVIAEHRNTNAVWLFARALVELLEPMYSGTRADRLLFENKTLAHDTIGYMIREIFLARICKCLCLLAYNFKSNRLREFVWQSITSLRRDLNRRFTPLCSRYVQARTWPGIVAAVRASAAGSTHDEMVQIVHTARDQPRPVEGVRQIVYEQMADIPRLLGYPQWMISTRAGSHGPQEADVVPTMSAATTDAANNAPNDEEAEADERLPEDAPIDMPSIAEPEPRSEEELLAGAKIYKMILWAHRRVEQRKQGADKSALTSGLLEFFAECRGRSLVMGQPHRLYRVYFLGPLPHLLLCLDIAHTRAQEEMEGIQSEFKGADHKSYEDLDRKRTDVQRFLSRVIAIQKALNPTAEIHTRRNLSDLKELVGEAVTLLTALPFGTPPGLSGHLNIAYKGILQPWRAATRRMEPKPQLNTEDEFEMY
ncbi:hypothetical protein DFH08DRAFT_1075732 [Mycena albidolilacea]|uniref:UvrD-like helicase ATP-binding domain-containing protein n=1 Tax=Mycena albidolilacea TaxID=1033008 RepID=A0AAD7AEC1_9AGAR|nr:hypothetical protein DFH08DRAFT_1075732 [Mycena albidolilacea]